MVFGRIAIAVERRHVSIAPASDLLNLRKMRNAMGLFAYGLYCIQQFARTYTSTRRDVKLMQFLCIGVNGSTEEVMRHINEALRQLKNRKISYSINEINSEGSSSIICMINDGRFYREKSLESYKILKTYISNALADYIIRQYEEKLLMRIINSNYCYFNAAEKKEILQRALGIIRNEDKTFINSLFQIRRRNVIIRRLMDYFDNSNSIIIDGF